MGEELDMMSALAGGEPSIFVNNEEQNDNSENPSEVFSMEDDNTENSETTTETNTIKLNKEDCVSVSDIILNNTDKLINTHVLNSLISSNVQLECDLVHYIVYINTKKNIPCIFDCDKLYVPKTSVLDNQGNYLVESIEGRRSGFVIKLTNGRHLVMSKNFIYDVLFENGKIASVYEYNRKIEKSPLEIYPIDDFDSASLAVRNVLPKVIKRGKFETLEELFVEVRKSYESVDDINAMFKIIYLMQTIGA